ncbi:MAG TPA: type II secretion system protein [Verrucomicrobiae bacterium]|nr:type II secretion system protein [Verrucomicrobiae bacterium]
MRYHLNRLGRSAFTLVELLVVMGIIAALAGLLFPVAGGVQRQVKKVKTRALFASLKMGVDMFYSEYQRMPKLTGAGSGGDVAFKSDDAMGREMVSALTGDVDDDTAKRLNPKTLSFCEFTEKQLQDSDTRGFGGYLIDGFGNTFYMVLDYDYDGKIDRNKFGELPPRLAPQGDIRSNFAAWSRGSAKDVGSMTPADIVASWK